MRQNFDKKDNKNIKNSLLIILLSVLPIVGLAGCTSESESYTILVTPELTSQEMPTPEPTPTETPMPEPTEMPVIESTPEPVIPVYPTTLTELSADWYSFAINLNGVVYTIPFPFDDLLENGWEFLGRGSFGTPPEIVDPNRVSPSIIMIKDNGRYTIHVSVMNRTYDVIPFEEGEVMSISIEWHEMPEGADFTFPGGISIGSSYEDVVSMYGEPTRSTSSATISSVTYEIGAQDFIRISFNNDTQQVISLRMQSTKEREAPLSTIAAENLPEIVAAYSAPTDFGSRWQEFIVRYGGHLYHIPAPLAALVANGWAIQSDPEELIPAHSARVGVEIRLGNQVLRTTVRNYDDVAQPIKYGYVTRVQYFPGRVDIPIELIGGITNTSTIEEAIEAFGNPSSIGEGPNFNTYSWQLGGRGNDAIVIAIENATGKITRIEVNNEPRRLD